MNMKWIGKGYRYGRSSTLKESDWKKAYVYIEPESNSQMSESTTKEVVDELNKN